MDLFEASKLMTKPFFVYSAVSTIETGRKCLAAVF